MRIMVGGDVVPGENNQSLFETGDIRALLGEELRAAWEEADIRMFNLECPVTDEDGRLFKNGPCLRAGAGCLNGIAALKPDVLLLANNHILDAGSAGLKDLLDNLGKRGIPYVGAGRSPEEMHGQIILERGGKRIGVYACCDREFSLAKPGMAGAQGLTERSFEAVREMKRDADCAIAVYHGGKEYYRYPSPELRDICRRFVLAGADLVLCQHSHCIGAKEYVGGSVVVYGQGNFIFTKKRDDFWKSSLLVQADIGERTEITFRPIVQTDVGTRLAAEEEAAGIMEAFEKRSLETADEANTEKLFSAFSQRLLPSYLYTFAGWGRLRMGLDRKLFHSRLIMRHYSKKRLAAMWNFIAAQAHREVLLRGLEDEMYVMGEKKDG